jgi:hypothetical protein
MGDKVVQDYCFFQKGGDSAVGYGGGGMVGSAIGGR